MLRAHLGDLGFAVPEPHPEGAVVRLGTAESLDVFLFRDLTIVRGARREPAVAGPVATKVYALGGGATPMNNTIYRYVLKRSRLASLGVAGVLRLQRGGRWDLWHSQLAPRR